MIKKRKGKYKDGSQVGCIKIISVDYSREYKSGDRTYYLCECVCGKQIIKSNSSLKAAKLDCGCLPYKDLTNQIFGNIQIIEFDGFDKRYNRNRSLWKYKCLLCGTIKSSVEETINRGDVVSCGKCKPHGKNHPRYNENFDRYNRRDSIECKNWAKEIYKLDNYKCICCGNKKSLNAHHLDAWSEFPDKRFEISNGVTLCSDIDGCHKKFHDEYGYGKNTVEQFEDFILSEFGMTLSEALKRRKK